MNTPQKTVLHRCHLEAQAKIVDFHGWLMPIQYPSGIISEHLSTRRHAGLFDVSHMGRFIISGQDALPFLQYALTNNAEKLMPRQAQYTLIANPAGGAVDDAYLYRFQNDQYLLVVNAGNKNKDFSHLTEILKSFPHTVLEDISDQVAMIALQGPSSKSVLQQLDPDIQLPGPDRNQCRITNFLNVPIRVSSTGYTGEPTCFELFIPSENAPAIWQALIDHPEVSPVGLGARDTLRLEAALPLYGHEFGPDLDGNDIPVLSCSTARFAVDPLKSADYLGKNAIQKQLTALAAFKNNDFSHINDLPRRIRCFHLIDKGIAREHCRVLHHDQHVGSVTSGTRIPYWKLDLQSSPPFTDDSAMRSIGLALIDSRITLGDTVQIQVRSRILNAKITPNPINNRQYPWCLPVLP